MDSKKPRMALIKLTRGRHAVVDDEDVIKVNYCTWNCLKIGYAQSNKDKSYMHRVIMGNPAKNIDHINGNKLDNRKSNLRLCDQSMNAKNTSIKRNNTSGFKGVTWDKRAGKWVVHITKNYKHIFGGHFNEIKDAALKYNDMASFHFGEFAKPNKI